MDSVVVEFRLRVKAPDDCLACVVGSCPELGSWDPLKAKVMRRSLVSDRDWYRKVSLQRHHSVNYRYFICRPLCSEASSKNRDNFGTDLMSMPGIVICKWESQLSSRSILLSGLPYYYSAPMVEFSSPTFDHANNWTTSDWLLNVTEVRIRLMGDAPIRFFDPNINDDTIGIRCCPMDCKEMMENAGYDLYKLKPIIGDDPRLAHFCTVSAVSVKSFKTLLGPLGACRPKACSIANGLSTDFTLVKMDYTCSSHVNTEEVLARNIVMCQKGQPVAFHAHTTSHQSLGFRFEFFSLEEETLQYLGSVYQLPLQKDLSSKRIRAPILGRGAESLGEVKLDCLVVQPHPKLKLNMEVSFKNCWTQYWPQLFSNYDLLESNTQVKQRMTRISSLRENTLASMKAAGAQDVEFLEFSVQLCKDKVPIVYHDFHVHLSSYKKQCRAFEVYEVPVMDMELATLHAARLREFSPLVTLMQLDKGLPSQDFRPFVELDSALKTVGQNVGFIIEVKYPQRLANGQMEVTDYFEQNQVVDQVISTTFNSRSNRKIVFASNHPDVCVMLNKKQNRYPVVFLCHASAAGDSAYQDPRTKSFQAALLLASSENLLGVAFLAEELIRDLRVVKRAHSQGLAVMVWGQDFEGDPDFWLTQTQADAQVTESLEFQSGPKQEKEIFYLPREAPRVDLSHARVRLAPKKKDCQVPSIRELCTKVWLQALATKQLLGVQEGNQMQIINRLTCNRQDQMLALGRTRKSRGHRSEQNTKLPPLGGLAPDLLQRDKRQASGAITADRPQAESDLKVKVEKFVPYAKVSSFEHVDPNRIKSTEIW